MKADPSLGYVASHLRAWKSSGKALTQSDLPLTDGHRIRVCWAYRHHCIHLLLIAIIRLALFRGIFARTQSVDEVDPFHCHADEKY